MRGGGGKTALESGGKRGVRGGVLGAEAFMSRIEAWGERLCAGMNLKQPWSRCGGRVGVVLRGGTAITGWTLWRQWQDEEDKGNWRSD